MPSEPSVSRLHRRPGNRSARRSVSIDMTVNHALKTVAVATVLVVTAAGCIGHSHGGDDPTTSAAPTPGISTVAQRQTHAAKVASDLLARVVVPAGARVFHGVVPELLKAPATRPAVSEIGQPDHVVDRANIWMVPESPTAVVTYLKAHRVAGTISTGPGGLLSDRGQVLERNLVFDAANSFGSDLTDIELQESVTPTSGGSLVRADAVAVWLSPRDADEFVPASDHVVTISRATTIPPIKPARRIVVTNRAEVAHLASIFNTLPVELDSVRSCPADQGVSYTIAYSTTVSAHPDVVVTAGVCLSKIVVRGHTATGLQTGTLLIAAANLLHISASAMFTP
jgi:hypothetical protein